MLLHQLHVSKKAIQAANERAEEANQRTRDKEIEVDAHKIIMYIISLL